MKRAFLFSLAIFSALLLIPKKANTEVISKAHEMYLLDHEFHFITIYDTSDTCFKRKIYSMIDQEYDRYSICILIDEQNMPILTPIKTYAKKKDKAHLVKVISRRDDKPFSIMKKEVMESVDPLSVVIELSKNCIFADTETLALINTTYKHATSPLSLYSNFTSIPSFQENKEPITYETSALKISYAKNTPSETRFVDISLYLKEEQ